ncbi:hypothetical protein UPYG_G00158410 [Umbra pygmaea]|uniref:Uncharacterized protein n=1 Tax=Umbra pygmaea TaxID=75934 RepID=A0ABD0XJA5_UMBPY
MTPLIWLVTWLLQAHAAMCDLPAPVNLTLSSHHFVHILSWAPGPGTPSEVHYNVTFRRLRSWNGQWRDVAGCVYIRYPLVCNLTKELSDINNTYYWKVLTILGNLSSTSAANEGFVPIQETHLDPPVVTVNVCGSTLCVNLAPPVEALRDFYDTLHYTLNISKTRSSKRDMFNKDSQSLKSVILKDLANNTEYCVYVRISGKGEPQTAKSNYSQPQCAFTPAKSSADLWISVILCLLTVLPVVFGLLLFLTGFIRLKYNLPEVLNSIRPHKVLFLEPACTEPPDVESSSDWRKVVLMSDDDDASEAESDWDGMTTTGGRLREYEIQRAAATPDNLSSSWSSSRSSTRLCTDPNDIPSLSADPQSAVEMQPGRPGSPLLAAHHRPPLGPKFSPNASQSRPLSGFSPANRLPEQPQGCLLASDLGFRLSLEGDPGMVEVLWQEEEAGTCPEISLLSVSLGRCEETRPEAAMMDLEAQPPSVGGSPVIIRSDSSGWVTEPVRTNAAADDEESEDESTPYLCR